MIEKINKMLADAKFRLERYQKDYSNAKISMIENKIIYYESRIYTLQELLEYEENNNKTSKK